MIKYIFYLVLILFKLGIISLRGDDYMVFDLYTILRGLVVASLCLFAIFISRKITMKDKITLQKFFFNRYFILAMLFYAIIYMISNLVLFTIGIIVNTCMFQHMIMIGISEEMKKG